MKQINKFFEYLDFGMSGKVDYFDFSVDLENYLVAHYDEMYAEHPKLTYYASDIIPDVTEQVEPGMDPTEFYEQIKKIKDDLLMML